VAPVVRIKVAEIPAANLRESKPEVAIDQQATPVEPVEAEVVLAIETQEVATPDLAQENIVAEAAAQDDTAVEIPVLKDVAVVEPLVPVGATLESLETFVVINEEPIVVESADSLPEGDQHLSLVGNLTQGSWFEMQSEDGQKFRSRLAAIIRATGKYIFVNRSGVKVAEETRMSLALALKSGRLQVLDDGMLFDRALEAVIGNLRNSR
jgi:hypothetical protein